MNKCLLLLFLSVVSCAQLQKKKVPDSITLLIKENNQKQKITVPLDYKEGLALVTSENIEQLLNVQTDRSSFSYVSPREIEIEIQNCSAIRGIIFSSFKQEGCTLKKRKISNYVIGIANPIFWKIEKAEVLKTQFNLITSINTKIPVDHWKATVKKIWEEYESHLHAATDIVTFVELDWAPISGGPIGENVLALFYQDHITSKGQKELLQDLDWKIHGSTMEYVLEYYKNSSNPWEDYLTGTYAHELAHIYFGFGVTRERVKQAYELWFSLGMGMIYDVLATQKLTGHFPPLYSSSEGMLKKFEKYKEIDQRLVNPDVSNDKNFYLDRKKIYAHSKAFNFLYALRSKLGPGVFDEATVQYLNDCKDCEKGYEDFKKFLPESKRDDILEIEKQYQVYGSDVTI